MTRSSQVVPRGPFSLAAATAFAAGTPSGQTGADGALDLAFCVEGSWRGTAVRATQPGGPGTAVHLEVGSGHPDDHDAAVEQAVRTLSLDVDATTWPDVADRDPVVADLQHRFAGLRPVQFGSPFEAAVWAVAGQRVRMTQTAALRRRLTAELGEPVAVGGRELRTFPSPQVVAGLGPTRGLTPEKLQRLQAIARAALDGVLDGAALRAVPAEEAMARVAGLPGIGPFSAELVVVRGAGHPDVLPQHEPRFAAAAGELWGLGPEPEPLRLQELSHAWRPFRSWVAVLTRASTA